MATPKYACGKCGELVERAPNGLPIPCPRCGSLLGFFDQDEAPKPQHSASQQECPECGEMVDPSPLGLPVTCECGATLCKTQKASPDTSGQKPSACTRCGTRRGLIDLLTMDLGKTEYVCKECEAELAKEKQRREVEERKRQAEIRDLATKVVVTSTHSIDGFKVRNYLGIESFECVIGTGLFSEITTDFQDLFGRRSSAFEQKLQAAKNTAFDALKVRAAEKGANAILGVDLDYTEFSGNRIGLIVNGTLVEVVPID